MWARGTSLAEPEEPAEPETRRRIAVLVDGDNAQPQLLDEIMKEVARHGTPLIRRIYGDWASGRLGPWTKALHEFAFQAVQQHVNSPGKNATDSRLIIEAMDLLHTAPWLEGYCLVSSDADYTALAKRLREGGRWVLGIGEKKTPPAFVKACERFTYTELLVQTPASPKVPSKASPKPIAKGSDELLHFLLEAVRAMERDDGYANLSQMRQWIGERKADFDPRSYLPGASFSRLFKLFPKEFEFKVADGQTNFNWVRRTVEAEA